jgi:hypothetical protein
METKWIAIGFAVTFSAMALGVSWTQQARNQCKIVAMQSGYQADDIRKVCGQ